MLPKHIQKIWQAVDYAAALGAALTAVVEDLKWLYILVKPCTPAWV